MKLGNREIVTQGIAHIAVSREKEHRVEIWQSVIVGPATLFEGGEVVEIDIIDIILLSFLIEIG